MTVRTQTGLILIGMLSPLCLSMMAWLGPGSARQAAPLDDEPIAPIAAGAPAGAAKIALGEKLFHDVRLSHGNDVACSSCHRLDRGGDDGRALSVAANGQRLGFNAPTVFNAAFNFRLNWLGNFRTMEEQNEAVLLDGALMNTSWEELQAKLGADQDYRRRFAEVYGAAPERADILDALAAYQRSLVTPDARFDRYLRGAGDAITADEEEGYRLFKSYGCISCHQGANVGGNLFQKFGIFSNALGGQEGSSREDLGRFAITGLERDRHVFRVPSLRNVAVTAPYFHDGRTASLAEAVEIMARSQLGRELPERDIELIVKFLETLTGAYRGRALEEGGDPPRQ